MTTNPSTDNGVRLLAAWLAGNTSGLQHAIDKLAAMTTLTTDDTPNAIIGASCSTQKNARTESEAA
jgi:hypothetical protein